MYFCQGPSIMKTAVTCWGVGSKVLTSYMDILNVYACSVGVCEGYAELGK
jgi:hypothetical protein